MTPASEWHWSGEMEDRLTDEKLWDRQIGFFKNNQEADIFHSKTKNRITSPDVTDTWLTAGVMSVLQCNTPGDNISHVS